ncbi:hypothetical protein LRD18_10495 [Halorhodospira halochloris]|uniref:hypothetical protein n=1 Tax=Halorhodospira halochloris TaxID=1052 RepID=UPI001EE78CEE|nr:hypothetical protein [Halorhodospira halochloris]MCG5531284.1 hypothetical protein [Halorhodospira halochloris]
MNIKQDKLLTDSQFEAVTTIDAETTSQVDEAVRGIPEANEPECITHSQNGAYTWLSLMHAIKPNRLSKSYRLDSEASLVQEPGGHLARGNYRRVDINGPNELAELITKMEPSEALCFGVAATSEAPIATQDLVKEGEIARTRDYLDWPAGPGWLLVDYDKPENEPPLSGDELWNSLISVWPDLADAPAVIGPSGSSYIYNIFTGEQLVGAGGLRVYIQVADARDIPRAGRALHDRLWLEGYGYYKISKSGQYLERSLVDTAVWQPERLDFAAGAHCETPLEQRRPEPKVLNPSANPIDTSRTIPCLDTEKREQLKSLQTDARAALQEQQTQIREKWIKERLRSVAEEGEIPQARARLMRALEHGELPAEFQLFSHSRQDWVLVRDLLDDRENWHDERFADPLEPDYQGDTRIAWANLKSGSMPYLYSHAHGGQRFFLTGDLPRIRVRQGEMPELIQTADRILTNAGEVYQRGGELVRILGKEGHTQAVNQPWLRTHLEERAHWLKYDRQLREWTIRDCPGDLATRILHNRGAWGVPELTGIVRGPILRNDGSLLKQPGYDPHTGLLLLADHPDGWPWIPEYPSPEQINQALARLWEPFEHFPFVDSLSRSIFLAAILTAVQRPMLETAPAFGFNAYKAGSGKSKAAKAIGWLGGDEPVE